VADNSAKAAYVAADMAAQAEHDPDSRAILISTDGPLVKAVQTKGGAEVASLLAGALK